MHFCKTNRGSLKKYYFPLLQIILYNCISYQPKALISYDGDNNSNFNYYLNSMTSNQPILRVGEEQQVGLLKKEARRKAQPREQLADKLLMYLRNGFWVVVAGIVIYYSNFFHNLFRNPSINQLFFQISMAGYTIIVAIMLFSTFIMPRISGTTDIEEYNPKLVPIGAVVGLISIISLIIAIWPIWGWWSLFIFISIWKGFFGLSVFLPGGDFGQFLFVAINAGTVLSFYVIEHQGYLH